MWSIENRYNKNSSYVELHSGAGFNVAEHEVSSAARSISVEELPDLKRIVIAVIKLIIRPNYTSHMTL